MSPRVIDARGRSLGWDAHIAPYLPAALVSEGAGHRIRPVLRSLPHRAVNHVYVECRLRADEDQVDVIVGLPRRERPVLVNEPWRLSDECVDDPAKARVETFIRRWVNGAYDTAAVTSLWVEHDIEANQSGTRVRVPSIFVEIAPGRRLDAYSLTESVARPVYRDLTGEVLSADVTVRLESALRCLPRTISVPYLGIMLGRPSLPIRLCALGLSRSTLVTYLRSIEWPGDTRLLAGVLEAIEHAGPLDQSCGLVHLDLGTRVLSQIGVEYVLRRRCQAVGELAEAHLMESLVGWGLCDRRKCDALLGWPGYSVGCLAGEPWESVFVRRINNLKIMLDSEGTIHAKTYLCTTRIAMCELRVRRRYDGA